MVVFLAAMGWLRLAFKFAPLLQQKCAGSGTKHLTTLWEMPKVSHRVKEHCQKEASKQDKINYINDLGNCSEWVKEGELFLPNSYGTPILGKDRIPI